MKFKLLIILIALSLCLTSCKKDNIEASEQKAEELISKNEEEKGQSTELKEFNTDETKSNQSDIGNQTDTKRNETNELNIDNTNKTELSDSDKKPKITLYSSQEEIKNIPKNEKKGYIENGRYINEFIGLEYDLPTNGNWHTWTDKPAAYNNISGLTSAALLCIDLDNTLRRFEVTVFYGDKEFGGSSPAMRWVYAKAESELKPPEKTEIDGIPFEYISYERQDSKMTITIHDNGKETYTSHLDIPKETVKVFSSFGEHNGVAYYLELQSSLDNYDEDLEQFKNSIKIWK